MKLPYLDNLTHKDKILEAILSAASIALSLYSTLTIVNIIISPLAENSNIVIASISLLISIAIYVYTRRIGLYFSTIASTFAFLSNLYIILFCTAGSKLSKLYIDIITNPMSYTSFNVTQGEISLRLTLGMIGFIAFLIWAKFVQITNHELNEL